MEDRITINRTEDGGAFLEARPFVDLGYVWNSQADSFFDQNFLLGAGVGVNFNPLDGLSAKIDFGFPIISVNEVPSDSPSGPRFYFDIDYLVSSVGSLIASFHLLLNKFLCGGPAGFAINPFAGC